MARLELLLAFLALVLVASTKKVSAHRTTVVVDDDENPGRSQGGCGEKVHELLHCRHYLSLGRQILAMRRGIDEPERQQQLQECCQQLGQVEEPCRCEGIRKVVREQSQREKLQGRELRELVQKAQDLPSICRVPPQQRCLIDIAGLVVKPEDIDPSILISAYSE